MTDDELTFPVDVKMPHADGPLIFTYVSEGTTHTYEVVKGHASASNRTRLAELLEHGGTISPTTRSGAQPD